MELAFLPLGFISCLEDCWQHSKAGCGGRMDDNQLLYSSVSYQKPITKAKSFMCGIVYLQVAGVMSHAGLSVEGQRRVWQMGMEKITI